MGFSMILKHRHIGIVVADIEKSKKFYCDLLGFKQIQSRYEKGDYFNKFNKTFAYEADTVKLEINNGAVLELLEYKKPLPFDRVGEDQNIVGKIHQCYEVRDITMLYVNMLKNNVKILCEPIKSVDDPCYVMSCLDPDRNMIQFVELLGIRGSYYCHACDFMSPIRENWQEHLLSEEHSFRTKYD